MDLGETKTSALASRLGREERIEGSTANLLGHTRSIIANGEPYVATLWQAFIGLGRYSLAPKRDGNRPGRPADCIPSIDDEVEESAFQLVWVSKTCPDALLRYVNMQRNPFARGSGKQTLEPVHDLGRIKGSQIKLLAAGKGE
jgi:hypothetical protein